MREITTSRRTLPRLAKGSDAGLSELARRELGKPTDPKAKLAVADGWDSLASQDKTRNRAPLEEHAADWYRQFVDELSGVEQLRVQKKLATADTEKSKRESTTPAVRTLRPGVVGECFIDMGFQKRGCVRIDRDINADWGLGSPAPSIPEDRFTVRWHGYLRAPKPGKYTLRLSSGYSWMGSRSLIG